MGATIPQVSSTGSVMAIVHHHINADGAHPVTCSVSADATGKTFIAMKVTTQIPGTNGGATPENTNFPLAGGYAYGYVHRTTCTVPVGATANVCLVKCESPVGSFGSVVPVRIPVRKKARVEGLFYQL